MNRIPEIQNPESEIIKVLLIEDNPGDARLVREMLIEAGINKFNLEHVERISEGLNRLSQDNFQVILLDLSLLDSHGLETVDRVCNVAPYVPVLVLTGLDDETLAIRAVQKGAQDYLVKGQMDGKLLMRAIRYATERKRAEEVVRESEERFRELYDNAPVGYHEYDAEGRITNVNRTDLEMLGYTREEMIGQPMWKFNVEEDIVREQILAKLAGTMPPGRGLERIYKRKDGTTIPVLIEDRLLRDPEGNIIGIRSTIQDITERKQAEEVIKESEERYRTAIENSNDGVAIVKGDFHLYVNQKFLEIFGYNHPEEIVGKPLSVTVHPDDRDLIMGINLKRQKGEDAPSRYEFKGIRKDGDIVYIEVSATKTIYRGEAVSLSYLRDITERKRAEQEMMNLQEQFRQSQKMEAIGRLAGGIAHDFNNLLTIIKGYSQLSLIELKEGDPLGGNIEEIKGAADKASDLIRQLLAFSRRQVMEMRVLDLNILLRDLDKMLRRVIGEDIELVTLLTDDLGKVKADPGQIEQVIMNLAVNARDAMLSGGKLTIETANVELDEAYARRHVAVTPGRYVMLAVSDTGVGMTPEVRERLFEPFFTTKEEAKGTGLGLSTVYGIVKQSGGNVWVYSEPGHGTTFKIYLPQVDEPLEEVKEKVVGEELPRGSETILVVEDDEEVRKLAVRVLKRQGYKVLEASNGADTLTICKEQKEPFHLILTDVVMPQMSGRQLVEQLRQVYQNFKVLYMSGYTDNTIVHHGVLERGINYIQKPFTVGALAGKVREVLDNKEG